MRTINKPIEVIATFSAAGIPAPHRIRIKNDGDDESTVLQISKILFAEKLRDVDRSIFWLFSCRTIVGDRITDFEIKFNMSSCIWYLYKM